jgi:glycosyltransferase involved in cell wall biosynthesis
MSKFKIAMLGASLAQNGGIATVEKLMLKYASSETEIQHITTHDEGSIFYRTKVFSKALAILLLRLLTRKTDVVHIHISDGGSLVRKAIIAVIALAFRKPVLIHTHGAEFHVTYSKLPKTAQQILSKIFRRCEGFLVLSKTWKEYYVSNLGLNEKQVVVLPNPTELPVQIPNRINVSKVKFGFFGRVGQRKGTFDLLAAYAKLPIKLKDRSQLIIAGDGNIQEAQNLVDSLHLTNYVTFLGWIDAQTRDKLLPTIDVFVLPSYNEGLPMALLEAMGWGLPAIVTPVGGIPELIVGNKNGLLVIPGDIQQLSDEMQLLIENETLRISLGNAARLTVAPFDVKIYSKQLDEIYRSLLESHAESQTESQTESHTEPHTEPHTKSSSISAEIVR